MRRKIGIVGLGVMGLGIGKNYLEKDYELFFWNRTESKKELLPQGYFCSSPKEVAQKSDIIFEVTANDESSKSVWLSDEGILAGSSVDKILITSATLSSSWMLELISQCEKEQFNLLDIPLTGGRRRAESGELTLLCGGSKEILQSIELELGIISEKILHFGKIGNGMKYKLITNMLQAAHLHAFGEAMKLAQKGGLDEELVASSLCEKPGGKVTNFSSYFYFNPPEEPIFSLNWMLKDLKYARDLGQDEPLYILDSLVKKSEEYIQKGYGESDWSIVNKKEKN